MGVQVDHLTQHAENIGDRIAVIDDRGNSATRYVSYVAFNSSLDIFYASDARRKRWRNGLWKI